MCVCVRARALLVMLVMRGCVVVVVELGDDEILSYPRGLSVQAMLHKFFSSF